MAASSPVHWENHNQTRDITGSMPSSENRMCVDALRRLVEKHIGEIEAVTDLTEDAVNRYLDPLDPTDIPPEPGPDIKEDVTSELQADGDRFWREMLLDRSWWTDELIGQTLRKSFFVTTYAIFENDLNHVCDELGTLRRFTLRVADLHGNGIVRAQSYIKKVLQVHFPDQSEEWATLKKVTMLRNAIVHVGGRLSADKIRHIDSLPGVEVYGSSLVLTGAFQPHVVHTLRGFWSGLFDAL